MKADIKKAYKLVELRCDNFKKLKAVAVKIDGTVFKISGKNEAGKSSLLDAVAAAIGGKDAFPKEPVRKGEDKAEIFLDFGGLKLTRKIWNKEDGGIGHSLILEYADGKRPRQPQDILDTLRGSAIADDPIAFARLRPRERYDLLKKLVPNFDFDDMAAKRKELCDTRTTIGRDYERAKGAAASIQVPPDAPLTPVDVSDLGRQLQEAIAFNAQIDARAARREGFADELEAMRDRADSLAAELKALNTDIATREMQIKVAEKLPAKVDIDGLQQKIATAETVNAGARKRAEKLAREGEAKTLGERYDALTASLKALDEAKVTAIENAKLPVPELGFGDNEDILLDGLPFDQASTARKIRVSTALLMALKPELRVLLIREGSLLDDDARAALEADAEKHGFVVLMEIFRIVKSSEGCDLNR